MTPKSRFLPHKILSPYLLLTLLAITISLPLILPLHSPVLNDDFLVYCTHYAVIRESILHFRTLALETPALAGGYPTVANPESPALNPFILISLFWGEVANLKIVYLIYVIASGIGGYSLCRYSLHLTRGGAFYAGASLILCSALPGKYVGGNINEAQLMLLPLGLHLLLQSRDQRFFFALVALGWLLITDATCVAFTFWLYMFVAAALWDLSYLRRDPLKRPRGVPLLFLCLVAFCLTLLLGAVKILPVIQFFQRLGGFKPSLLLDHFSDYASNRGFTLAVLPRKLADVGLALKIATADDSFLIGPVTLLVAIAALIMFPKHSWRLGVMVLFSVWLACANHIRPDLFKLFWMYIPIFNMMSEPAKYFGPLVAVFLCLSGGVFVSRISRKLPKGIRLIFAAAILIISAPFPLAIHHLAWRKIVHVPSEYLAGLGRLNSFFQVETRKDPVTPPEFPSRSISYFNFKLGLGTIDSNVPIIIPTKAIARYFIIPSEPHLVENPRYVGEIEYSDGSPVAGEVTFRPNRINVNLRIPSLKMVVINRNYDFNWQAQSAQVINFNGRLAIIPNQPNLEKIVISYKPRAFYMGLSISLLTLIVIVLYLIYTRRRLMRAQTASFQRKN